MPKVSDSDLQQRRRDILDAARRCFADYGYEGATVRRLEEATGKTRGAIFHYFASKEQLFLELAAEDAVRMAEVVANSGLVEVMRGLLHQPEDYDWLATRLEITRMLNRDEEFRKQWLKHQRVLDKAVRARLESNRQANTMRADVSVDVLHLYLDTILDGFISRMASGARAEELEAMLDFVEHSIRR